MIVKSGVVSTQPPENEFAGVEDKNKRKSTSGVFIFVSLCDFLICLLCPSRQTNRCAGLKAAKIFPDVFEQTKVAADAGYHSGASVTYTQENNIDAYIADRSHRQRDPAFADYDRYKTRFRKDKRRYHGIDSERFTAKDFIYDEKDEAAVVRRAIGCIETAAILRSTGTSPSSSGEPNRCAGHASCDSVV